jgi:hypothetical protein
MSNPDLAKTLAKCAAVDSRDEFIQTVEKSISSPLSEYEDKVTREDTGSSKVVLVSKDSLLSAARTLSLKAAASQSDVERIETEMVKLLFAMYVVQWVSFHITPLNFFALVGKLSVA